MNQLRSVEEYRKELQANSLRLQRAQGYFNLKKGNPRAFTLWGELKNKFRNKKCPCKSGLKLKYCHGISYSEAVLKQAEKQEGYNLGNIIGGRR